MGQKLPRDFYLIFLYAPLVLAYLSWYLTVSILFIISCQNKSLKHKPVSPYWSGLLKFTFIGSLRRERIGPNKKRYKFFSYPVTPLFVRTLVPITLFVWLNMFVAFWTIFLIKSTDSCDKDFDCFHFNKSLIENCKLVDISVLCYRVQFDIIRAAGTAGGIQGLMIILVYGLVIMYMWFHKKLARAPVNKKNRWILIAIILIAIPFLFEMLLLAIDIAIVFTPGPNLLDDSSAITDFILRTLFLTTILIVTLFPLRLIKDSSKLEFDANTTEKEDIENGLFIENLSGMEYKMMMT